MTQLRAVVIDDEPAITALIERVARQCGYEVFGTSDVAAFKLEVSQSEPTVICIDLAMPGTDGVELLRFLAARGCRSRLLIISGFDPRLLQSAVRLGEALGLDIAATIPKPIAMGKLRQLFEEMARPGPP